MEHRLRLVLVALRYGLISPPLSLVKRNLPPSTICTKRKLMLLLLLIALVQCACDGRSRARPVSCAVFLDGHHDGV